MKRLVRQITTVGNSIGVTLPRELLDVYGLQKGSLVEVRAIGMGLLLRPMRLPSSHAPPRKTLWTRDRRPRGQRRKD
ncbi:MAG: AbrB/MazE/SpoVT family DNA-binding domain-containing protein [Armatimonadota bacterium]